MSQQTLTQAAKAVIQYCAANNKRDADGRERKIVKVESALVANLHTAAIQAHEDKFYSAELVAGIQAYAQATLNRAEALLLPAATDEQRREFIKDLVVISNEQLAAFAVKQ